MPLRTEEYQPMDFNLLRTKDLLLFGNYGFFKAGALELDVKLSIPLHIKRREDTIIRRMVIQEEVDIQN